MNIILGDLISLALDGTFDVIVHGCNCHCRMKSGIAKTISEVFSEAVLADNATLLGDKGKLGTLSVALCSRGERTITVVNAYTQFFWARNETEAPADYDAIRQCMREVRQRFSDMRIGIPLIGAGLAGGDWATIERIILEELNGLDVTIVHFQA